MRTAKDPEAFAIPEPRIRFIAHELQRLLSLVDLEYNGRPVAVDGFRLKDLSQWVSYTTNTAMNALTPISSACNSRCHFCFEENAPYAREAASLMPMAEARTRLKYFDPGTGASLFPSSRNHMETFVHPRAVDIIEMAREHQPDQLFWITTNGSHFTEPVVAKLATLKPLIFKLSINVADAELNRELMGTKGGTDVALEAPRVLQKWRLPFMGSIVAWPTTPLEKIEETVRYLEECEAYAVRIRLPLSHQWLKQQLDVDFHEHWRKVAAFGHELRRRTSVALFVEPPIYWVNPIVPEIDGVVKNSPADRAGLRAADVVRRIGGVPVRTRIHSESLLDQHHLAGDDRLEITVERDGEELTVDLEHEQRGVDTYPYDREVFYRGENYGIFHVEDFRLTHIQRAINLMKRYAARRVLLFSSAIVAPIFATIVTEVPEFAEQLADIDVRLATVQHNSFGGNYDVMDSRVVEDYAAVVRERLARGEDYDLILVPDAFGSPWGHDVFGASYVEMAMEFGIPVERIDWLLVYGREV